MASEAAYLLSDDGDFLEAQRLASARRFAYRSKAVIVVCSLAATVYSAHTLTTSGVLLASRRAGPSAAVTSVRKACGTSAFLPSAVGGPSGRPLAEQCPDEDRRAWCGDASMAAGTNFGELCGAACAAGEDAWAMVCAWQAVARLEEVCAGTFAPSFPDLDALPAKTAAEVAAPLEQWPLARDSGELLFSCDVLAVCAGCADADGFSERCAQEADRHGGFGSPDWADPEELRDLGPDVLAYGATTAVKILNEDLGATCDRIKRDKKLKAREAVDLAAPFVIRQG